MGMGDDEFFCMGIFLKVQKDFGSSQKIRKKFPGVREKSENYFSTRSVHAPPTNRNYSKPLKKPHKTPNSPT